MGSSLIGPRHVGFWLGFSLALRSANRRRPLHSRHMENSSTTGTLPEVPSECGAGQVAQ
jgi:hypothetical protein